MFDKEHITVTSNSAVFPNNRNNNFRVRLPKSLKFRGGKYSCALHSISYPYSWSLMEEEDIFVVFRKSDNDKTPPVYLELLPGNFTNNTELVNYLNASIQTLIESVIHHNVKIKSPPTRKRRETTPLDVIITDNETGKRYKFGTDGEMLPLDEEKRTTEVVEIPEPPYNAMLYETYASGTQGKPKPPRLPTVTSLGPQIKEKSHHGHIVERGYDPSYINMPTPQPDEDDEDEDRPEEESEEGSRPIVTPIIDAETGEEVDLNASINIPTYIINAETGEKIPLTIPDVIEPDQMGETHDRSKEEKREDKKIHFEDRMFKPSVLDDKIPHITHDMENSVYLELPSFHHNTKAYIEPEYISKVPLDTRKKIGLKLYESGLKFSLTPSGRLQVNFDHRIIDWVS